MLNMPNIFDGTEFIFDRSDGRTGGQPAYALHLKDQFHAVPATNKSGSYSTLICGPSARVEA